MLARVYITTYLQHWLSLAVHAVFPGAWPLIKQKNRDPHEFMPRYCTLNLDTWGLHLWRYVHGRIRYRRMYLYLWYLYITYTYLSTCPCMYSTVEIGLRRRHLWRHLCLLLINHPYLYSLDHQILSSNTYGPVLTAHTNPAHIYTRLHPLVLLTARQKIEWLDLDYLYLSFYKLQL